MSIWKKITAFFAGISKNSVIRIYRRLLHRHRISSDGTGFYTEGRNSSDPQECDSYIANKITPFFISLQQEAGLEIAVRKEQLEVNKAEHSAALLEAEKSLTESLKEEGSEDPQDIPSPERQLHDYIKERSESITKKMDSLTDEKGSGNASLAEAVRRRELSLLVGSQFSSFKKLLDQFTVIRQDMGYPPKLRRIISLYLLCIILCFGEAGFSIPIIREVMDTGINPDNPSLTDTCFSILYAVVISLSMAVTFKILIDTLWYKGKKKRGLFWRIGAFFWLFFTVLFSTYSTPAGIILGSETGGFRITQLGILLGFFSCLFALANAFTFRKAADMHNRYGIASVRNSKRRKKEKLQRIWKEECSGRRRKIAMLDKQLEMLADALKQLEDLIRNLMQLSITAFRKGCKEALLNVVSANRDLVIQMMNFLFKKQRK